MSNKYPPTPYFPFSLGISRDDKVNFHYWERLSTQRSVILEKCDGENTCINKSGVYARSHCAPTQNPWANHLKQKWASIKNDLGNRDIFGENLYAVHSIEYTQLEHHLYVFAIRELDRWLSWEEVNYHAQRFDLPVVPVIDAGLVPQEMGQQNFEKYIAQQATKPSALGGEREGLVIRVEKEFANKEFQDYVLKWVRADHVATDEHWRRHWKKARLNKIIS